MVLVGEKPDPSIKTTGIDPTGSCRQQLYHWDSPAINESVGLFYLDQLSRHSCQNLIFVLSFSLNFRLHLLVS